MCLKQFVKILTKSLTTLKKVCRIWLCEKFNILSHAIDVLIRIVQENWKGELHLWISI